VRVEACMKKHQQRTPSTHKVRRDLVGGKRGDGNRRRRAIRRPDPHLIRVGSADSSLSAVAGLVMFGVFVRELGVDRALLSLFGDLKSRVFGIYPMEAQLRLLIDLFVVGEHRVFGIEGLAADPLFVLLAGGVLPSLDTVYRDLDRFDDEALSALTALMASHGLEPVRGLRKRKRVHLDIDTSVTPVFGDQMQGAVPGPNPHYHGRPSYHPILARVAETDTCVNAELRPGDTSFGNEDARFVDVSIDTVREAIGSKPVLCVRIDAAGDCAAIMRTVQGNGAVFLTKARMTPDLCAAVMMHTRWQVADRDADGRACRQVAEIAFRRNEWGAADQLPVRVIAVRTRERERGKQLYLWEGMDWTVQVYLTNDLWSDADDLAWEYDGRAGIEPLIAEWKTAWGIGKFSCSGFLANAAAFTLKLLSHNLMRRYVEQRAPKLRHWRMAWVRRAMILVPGRLTRSGRKRTIHMQPRPVLAAQLE
jgi:hypothetical protein